MNKMVKHVELLIRAITIPWMLRKKTNTGEYSCDKLQDDTISHELMTLIESLDS